MRAVAGAALAGVAGKPLECGGAEEVDLSPGPALDAVDGAGPGVGAVGAAVRPAAGNERSGKRQEPSGLVHHVNAFRPDPGDGHDTAVVEADSIAVHGAM